MTVILGLLISITLLAELYITCSNGTFECTTKSFPMVSTVIALEMYDRVFILLTVILMFGIQQTNIRAFYKKLYGIIPDHENDNLMNIGLISCVALPLIGIFDEHKWPIPHGISAVTFFLLFGLYCIKLGRYLNQNKDKYPAKDQTGIKLAYYNSYGLIVALGALLLSIIIVHSHVPTPLIEWFVVLYFVNFFVIISMVNSFYDTVHQPGALANKAQ
jgi:hypothetical membrane protein